jgi:dihydroorotase
VVDPASGRDAVCDIFIENGVIRQIGNLALQTNLPADQVIDATGKIVTPGFIDLHTHLREPGQEYKETVASGMAAAAAGGFTTICAMPNTAPVNDNKAVTRLILEQARSSPHRGLRVLPVGAVTKGQQGKELTEMAELVDAGCVAFSDDGLPVATSEMMRRALEYAKLFDVPIIDHCEDLSLSAGGVMFEGAVSFSMGLKGIPAASETIIVARDIALAESTGGRVHLAHISTTGSVRLIREAKRRGIAVTAETCPHYFTLTDQEVRGFNADAKMKPPLAGEADRDEIRAGLADGTIDAIATDHAPHAPHEKEQTMDRAPFGIIGLETALPLSLRLVEDGTLSLSEMIRKWTENPARILRKPLGRLTPGEVADVTIFDPKDEWIVTPDLLKSKSKNSPFIGQSMRGRTVVVIASGRQIPCH